VVHRAETWVPGQARCALSAGESRRSIPSSALEVSVGYSLRRGGRGGEERSAVAYDMRGARSCRQVKRGSDTDSAGRSKLCSHCPTPLPDVLSSIPAWRVQCWGGLVEEGDAHDWVEGGAGGLSTTAPLRYCFLAADGLQGLREAASDLSFC